MIPYWLDHCPICGGPVAMACRCFRNDRVCHKGHVWERDYQTDKATVLDKPHGAALDPQPELPHEKA